MEYLGKFGERLRYLINFNNDTAETLGAKLNVSGRTVRAWMRGETLILLPHAVALADHFCCSLDFLAGRSEHEERVEPRPLPPFYPRLRAVLSACNTTPYRVTADTPVKDSHRRTPDL